MNNLRIEVNYLINKKSNNESIIQNIFQFVVDNEIAYEVLDNCAIFALDDLTKIQLIKIKHNCLADKNFIIDFDEFE